MLQEQSTLPLKSPQRFHENVRLFAAAIEARNARTLLYLTWSRANVPEAQHDLTHAVEAIAREIGADVVPVGIAWHAVRNEHPDIALYDADGSHPTPTGSYLAACVFYAMVTGRDPAWSRFTAGLTRAEARFLQEVAVDVVAPYG